MTAIQSGYGAYKDVKGAVGKIKSFGTEAGKTIAAAETGNVFGAAYGTYKTYKAGDEAYKATTKAYESGQKAYGDFQVRAGRMRWSINSTHMPKSSFFSSIQRTNSTILVLSSIRDIRTV